LGFVRIEPNESDAIANRASVTTTWRRATGMQGRRWVLNGAGHQDEREGDVRNRPTGRPVEHARHLGLDLAVMAERSRPRWPAQGRKLIAEGRWPGRANCKSLFAHGSGLEKQKPATESARVESNAESVRFRLFDERRP